MDVADFLHACDQVTDLPRSELRAGDHVGPELPHVEHVIKGVPLHKLDLVPFAHRTRLAAGDFLQKRDTAVPRQSRAGQDELAALHFLVTFGTCRRRRRRAAGRIEQRAVDRLVQACDATFDLVFGQQRRNDRLGFDRLRRRRHPVQLAAPVGLDAD